MKTVYWGGLGEFFSLFLAGTLCLRCLSYIQVGYMRIYEAYVKKKSDYMYKFEGFRSIVFKSLRVDVILKGVCSHQEDKSFKD